MNSNDVPSYTYTWPPIESIKAWRSGTMSLAEKKHFHDRLNRYAGSALNNFLWQNNLQQGDVEPDVQSGASDSVGIGYANLTVDAGTE